MAGGICTGRVLENDVALLVLVVTERQQNNVSLVDPHLLPELAADMAKTAGAIEALGLETAVAEHLGEARGSAVEGLVRGREQTNLENLCVLLALLLKGELAFFVVVFVLSPTSVLATLRMSVSVRSSLSKAQRGGRWRGSVAAGRAMWCRKRRTFPLFLGMMEWAAVPGLEV